MLQFGNRAGTPNYCYCSHVTVQHHPAQSY